MRDIKHKIPKLILPALFLVCSVLFMFIAPVLPTAHADPTPSCSGGAILVRPTNGSAAYCKCLGSQVVVTGDTDTCAIKCPAGTTAGKKDSNGQVNCSLPQAATPVTPPAGSCTTGNEPSCPNVTCTSATSGVATCTDPAATDCKSLGSSAKPGVNCEDTICTASSCNLISKYVNPLITLLSALVGVAVTISIIIGGIQYGSSAGDPQKASAAKNRIRNSIVALVAFIFLFAFLQFLVPGGIFKS